MFFLTISFISLQNLFLLKTFLPNQLCDLAIQDKACLSQFKHLYIAEASVAKLSL